MLGLFLCIGIVDAQGQVQRDIEFRHGNLLSTNGDIELNWSGPVFEPPYTNDRKYILTIDGVDQDTWSTYHQMHFATNGTHTFRVRHCNVTCGTPSAPISAIISFPSQTTPTDTSPSFQGRVSFLYTGATPRQVGANPGAFDATRISVLRGKALNAGGTALAGVRVELVGAPQFGYTLTQANGEFDLAVNAASGMRLHYSKSGFLASERTVEPAPLDFSFAPDVVLLAPDSASTLVKFGQPDSQVMRASTVSDLDGSRRATLIFPPEVTATYDDGLGNTVSGDKLTIRATEYTVGSRGGLAMPAELPPTSGYTYAVELSADEVPAGSQLVFDRPVPYYVENFIGMPVGTAVPAGYYDANAGAWVAGNNGRIIKLLSTGGSPLQAQLDVTGDGIADTGTALDSLGITDDERGHLAILYTPGQELWRIPLTHFTPWDFNFPWGLPSGRKWPTLEDFRIWFRAWIRAAADCMFGSIIECQNQALRKSFGVAGTQITLNHRSEAQSGYKGDLSLDVPLFSDGKPDDLTGITVQVFVAGHKFERIYSEAETAALTGNEIYVFDLWDGRDIYGRDVLGTAIANVRLGYTYRATYYSVPSEFEASFGQYPGISWVDVGVGRDDSPQITIWHMAKRLLGHWNARQAGLGGLTLSNHAVYDAVSGVVQRGNGTVQALADGSRIVTTAAGIYGTPDQEIVDQMPWSYEIGPGAQAALDVRGMRVNAVATGTNGDKYFAVQTETHNAVFRLDANGEVSRVAGGGTNTSDNYVGPANGFDLGFTSDIAVGPDNSIYYADYYKGRIWRISPNGILSRFAGNTDANDPYAYDRDQDGMQARDVGMGEPIAITVAKDGTVYVSQTLELPGEHVACYPSVIRRIGTDGRVSTIFGRDVDDCDAPLPPDFSNLQKTWAKISDLAFDNNGNLVAAVAGTAVRGYVLRLRSTGGSDVLAGNFEFLDDDPRITLGFNGVPATSTAVSPNGIAFDANGGFYIAEGEMIRYVDAKGTISLAAGNLTCPNEWDEPLPEGSAAPVARVCEALSVTVDTKGDVFYADYHLSRLRTLKPSAPGGSLDRIVIPDAEGATYDVFSPGGRLLYRRDAYTGGVLAMFDYDADGLLTRIADGDTNIINIVPGASGVTIAAPYGETTTISGVSGSTRLTAYATALTNQASEKVELALGTGGLVNGVVDPRHAALPAGSPGRTRSSYQYTPKGRLSQASNATGRTTTHVRTELPSGHEIQSTTGQGRTRKDAVLRYPGGVSVDTSITEDGVATDAITCPDNRTIRRLPNGVTTTVVQRADPRFGLLAPLADLDFRIGGTPASTADCAPWFRIAESYWEGTAPTAAPLAAFTVSQERSIVVGGGGDPLVPASVSETTTIVPRLVDGSGAPVPCAGRPATGRTACRQYRTSFDAATRTYTTTSPMGRVSTETVDAQGRTLVAQSPGVLATTMQYDTRGRPTRVAQGTREQTFTYYATTGAGGEHAGKLATSTERISSSRTQTVQLRYDTAGRAASVTRPDASIVATAYDANGNLTSVVVPGLAPVAQRTHRAEFSDTDQVKRYIPPTTAQGVVGPEEWFYTPDGTLDRMVSGDAADSRTLQMRYETGKSRVAGMDFSGGSVAYGYDNGAPGRLPTGQIKTITAPGNVTLAYTFFGNLPASETFTTPDFTGSVTYAYDDNLWPVTLTVAGEAVAYDYDLDGMLVQAGELAIQRGASTGRVDSTTLRKTADATTYTTFGDADTVVATAQFASGSTEALRFSRHFTYDGLGRTTEAVETRTTRTTPTSPPATVTATERYTYDDLGRLTEVRDGGDALLASYGYDANGNRTTVGGAAVATFDTQDRLLQANGAQYAYRSSGELKSRTLAGQTTSYDYDELGNLRHVELSGGTQIDYVIDGAHRRVGKKRNGVFERGWLYKDTVNPVAAVNASGNVVQVYVYAEAGFVPAYVIDKTTGSTRLLRYFTDERGSVRYVVDADTGAIVQALRYDAWGGIVEDTNPGFQPFGFAGGLTDADTGFVQFGSRDYDPATGRWTRKDPIGMSGGANFYAYANNDPINQVDPLGHVSVDCRNWKFLVALMPGVNFLQTLNNPNSTAAEILLALLFEAPPVKAARAVGKPVAKAISIASGMGGDKLPMKLERLITHGEKVADIINEGKALTYVTGNEHAVVKLMDGSRALVSGGPGGFKDMEVRRIFGHTHPDISGPSGDDQIALSTLGQSKQYVFHAGEVTLLRPKK